MDVLERSLVAISLLALGALVAGSAPLAAAAAGLLVFTILLDVVPVSGKAKATRALDSARVVEGGVAIDAFEVDLTIRVPAVVTIRDAPPEIGDPQARSSQTLTVFGRITARHEVPVQLPVRGMAYFGPLEITIVDPLGLTVRGQRLLERDTVRVWPAAEALKEHAFRARYERMLAGRHPVRNPGASLNFYGIREYTALDPMRSVNWKATVRTGDLMVNQFEHETYAEATLFLDARVHTGLGTVRGMPIHGVARAAASFARGLRGQGDVLRAFAFGAAAPKRFRMEPGRPWLDQFSDFLAELEPGGDQSIEALFDDVLPRLTPKSIVIFVTPLVGSNPLGEAPVRSRALGNTTIVLCPGPPEGLPEPLATEVRDARARTIEEVRSSGIEVLDLERSSHLSEALDQRQVFLR